MNTVPVKKVTDTVFLRRDFALLAGLLLALRGAFVLALSDVFFYGEELEKGTAAKAILDGLPVAHHQLAYHYYEGGGFVISHLKALAFLLVGESLLAHKLVALVTCLAVFAAAWRLALFHFGPRAARIAAALFVLAPTSALKISLLSLGIHFESMLFSLLVLDEGLRWARARRPPRAARAAVLGLIAGFGIYFSYQVVIAVGFVGLALLARHPRWFLGRSGAAGLAGMVVGLAPLFVMAVLVGRAVLDIHGNELLDAGTRAGRLTGFLGTVFLDRDPADWVPLVLYPASYLVGVTLAVALTRGAARRSALALTGYLGLWLAAFAASGIPMPSGAHFYTWGRFAPVWTVAPIALAAALDRLLAGGPALRRGARVWGGALLLLGAANATRVLAGGRPTTPRANLALVSSLKGYLYVGYLPRLLDHLEGRGARRLAPLLAFDEPERGLLYADLAMVAFPGRRPLVDVLAVLDELDPDGRAFFEPGLGPTLVRATRGDLARALAAADGMGGEQGQRLAEAVGRFGRDWPVSLQGIRDEVAAHLDHPRAAAFLRGVGARVCRRTVLLPDAGGAFVLDPEGARAFLRSQPRLAVSHLLEGFDAELARCRLP